MNTRLLCLSLLGFWACSGNDRPMPPSASAPAAVAPAPVAPPRTSDAGSPVSAPKAVFNGAAARAASAPGPARSCAQSGDALVAPGAEDLALAANAHDVALLTVESGRTSVSLHKLAGDTFTRVFTHTLAQPVRALSVIAPQAGPALVAWVDGRAGLYTAALGVLGFDHVQHIADAVDTRFQPAFSRTRPLWLAYTRAVGEAMHTFVAVERGPAFAPARDVTPLGHGAAGATFVDGAQEPLLYAIDARAGLSPLLEIAFDGETPRAAVVRTPVSQPATPPVLRAVVWRGSEVHVAYTAIGKLAASAIGHVVSTRTDAPTALVPSFGYGELRMDALARAESAIFALEVPDDMPVTATRHIELVQVDARGEGAHFKLPAVGATRPRLAPGAGDEVFLGYVAADGVHIARLRCGS